jgi:hypothetical protein
MFPETTFARLPLGHIRLCIEGNELDVYVYVYVTCAAQLYLILLLYGNRSD